MTTLPRSAHEPSFLDSLSLAGSARPKLVVIAFLFVSGVLALTVPSEATLLMEVAFPLLAAYITLQPADDRFHPMISFPVIYLLWYWIGSIPLLPESRDIGLLDTFGDRQWLFYLMGFAAYWLGCSVLSSQGTRISRLRGLRVRWNEDSFFLLLLVLGGLILLSWASITVAEGIPIFKADVETLRVELPARHRIAYQLLVLSSDIMLPLLFLYTWTAEAPRFRRTMYAGGAFIVFIFISQGNRGLVLPSLLTIFAMRHYLVKPWPVRNLTILALILIPLVSVTGYFRSLQHFGPGYAIDLANLGIPIPLQPISNIYLYVRAPLNTFRDVTRMIPSVTPYQHGALTFGFLMQLLPGRHPSSDFFFKDLLAHTFEGFGEPASILGTFYADLGTTGIIAGMFLTGLLSKTLYLRMFRGSIGWLLVYSFFWQKLVGSLYGSLFTYVLELLLPIVWLLCAFTLAGPVQYARVIPISSSEPLNPISSSEPL